MLVAASVIEMTGTIESTAIRLIVVDVPVYSRKQTYPTIGTSAVPTKWPVRPTENITNEPDSSSIAPPMTQKPITTSRAPIGTVPTSRLRAIRCRPSIT